MTPKRLVEIKADPCAGEFIGEMITAYEQAQLDCASFEQELHKAAQRIVELEETARLHLDRCASDMERIIKGEQAEAERLKLHDDLTECDQFLHETKAERDIWKARLNEQVQIVFDLQRERDRLREQLQYVSRVDAPTSPSCIQNGCQQVVLELVREDNQLLREKLAAVVEALEESMQLVTWWAPKDGVPRNEKAIAALAMREETQKKRS